MVPQESMAIFRLPNPSQNQPLFSILASPLLLADLNFVLETSESVSTLLSDMRVQHVGEIVATFL
jgi:hypothetical protein